MTGGVACVLFTDLVGSTELMARLGDTAFDELRGEHFARVREVVIRHGGVEVKNTGDGILATFSSAVEALAAAVELQQATDAHGRRVGVPLALRVGLSLGEVATENGDVFGTPVVEAARLVAAARSGQILCTTVARVVAGSRATATFTDVGALELKGLPEPVPVCEVAWEPLVEEETAAAVPLPALLAGTGRIFVGRGEELERLGQLWKEAAAGERRLALLGGEPGIGKTRLAARLAERVQADGGLVLGGRCDEDLGVPFQPFVEGLRHYARHASSPNLGRYGGDLIRLVPDLGERIADLSDPLRSDPETERYRLFDAVAAWLADISTGTPVLLVLDDLHWAAKPTLLLLRHVLHSPESLRLLVVVTYRDTDVGRGHPLGQLLADLRRDSGVERFPLGGLDREAVGAYIEAAAGHALPDDDEGFARAVWAETEGNPFFVAEVLRHLTESGAIQRRDGRWVSTAPVEELGIPEGVRDVVGRRLSRLSEGTNPVLTVASVAGLEFDPTVVGRAGGFDEDALCSALEEAVAARLVAEVGTTRFRFAHALVRATLYDELSGPRRVSLHRRVAEAIEAVHVNHLDDHLPALAHHWARAAAPAAEADRAVEYATRAGDRALAQLAHDEAVSYYGQALELLDASDAGAGDARRLELLLALGEAQRRAGDAGHRLTLLGAGRLARERSDAPTLIRSALANTRGWLVANIGSVDAERVEIVEAALAAVDPADTAVRARLLATLAMELTFSGEGERLFQLSDDALAAARRSGDPATLASVLLARFYTINTPATFHERLANTAELLELSKTLDDPVIRCRAALLRWRNVVEAGDGAEAARCFRIAESLATEIGQPALVWNFICFKAGWLLWQGEVAAAADTAATAFDLARASGQPDALCWLAVQGYCVWRQQGRLGEFTETLREASRQFPGLPALLPMLAEAYCDLGREAEARAIFDPLAAGGFADLPFDLAWMLGISACTAVAERFHDEAAAATLYALLSPYAEQMAASAAMICGAATHHLGLLATVTARYDEAEAHFAAAAETHHRIGAPAWLARTQLEWARMLLRRGNGPRDVEQARTLLRRSLTTARELGLGGTERQAVELLGTMP